MLVDEGKLNWDDRMRDSKTSIREIDDSAAAPQVMEEGKLRPVAHSALDNNAPAVLVWTCAICARPHA